MPNTLLRVCLWFNVVLSSILFLFAIIGACLYLHEITNFYIRKRRPGFVVAFIFTLTVMAIQTAWDPFFVKTTGNDKLWRYSSWIGAGLCPSLCQFLYAARYWHLVYDINYHSALSSYWYRDIDKSFSSSFWISNHKKWNNPYLTVSIAVFMAFLCSLCGHFTIRTMAEKHWILLQYFLLEPIIYGTMMVILIWGYQKAKQKYTKEFDKDILFIHREFWKILYWVLFMFCPILGLASVLYLVLKKKKYKETATVVTHSIGVNLMAMILVYFTCIYPLVLKKHAEEEDENSVNSQESKTSSGNESSASKNDPIISKFPIRFLYQVFEKEKYIRKFVNFSSESLATENILAFVEILQFLKYQLLDKEAFYESPIPKETKLDINWIPINENLKKTFQNGCTYLYNKYLSNSSPMLINVSYTSANNFKNNLFKLKQQAGGKESKKEPSFSIGGLAMDEYLSKYIEKNEKPIEINESYSHIFDEILNDLWDNMESLFSIFKRSKPELSNQTSNSISISKN